MKKCLKLLALLFLSCSVKAKNYQMIHFNTENGLPSNCVYDILRDRQGYLWFCTNKGVARYNGISFENFSTSDGLTDNEVYYAIEDYLGRIWFGTYNGKLCYFFKGKFYNATNKSFLNLPGKRVRTEYINIEKDSSITIYFSDRAHFLNIKNERVQQYSLKNFPDKWSGFRLKQIKKAGSNLYEVLMEDRSVLIDTSGKPQSVREHERIRYHRFKGREYFIQAKEISDGTKKVAELPEELYHTEASGFYRIYCDSRYSFIGSSSGFFVNGKRQLLAEERVSSIANDIDSNYWISTLDNGVFLLTKNFLANSNIKILNKRRVVYGRTEGENIFYFSEDRNLYCTDQSGNTALLFDYQKYSSQKYEYINNGLYIDTNNAYIFIPHYIIIIKNFKSQKREITKFKCSIDQVKGIFFSKGNFIIKAINEIFMISKEEILSLPTISNNSLICKRTENTEIISGMDCDRNGDVWYSTVAGVFKVLNGNSVFQKQFGSHFFKKIKINGDFLLGITYENQLIVCTDFSSRIRFDTIGNNKCIWENIYSLDANHLLITTNGYSRIISFNEKQKIFWCSLHEDPFIPDNLDFMFSNSGRSYFFKGSSIVRKSLRELLNKNSAPRVIISSLETSVKSYAIDSLITMNYKESRLINIYFDAISYSSKNIIYEYAVSKGDEYEWNTVQNKEINIYNLPAGRYTFAVRAKTSSSDYSKIQVIRFVIEQAFWKTSWFISLSIIGVVGILFIFFLTLLRRKEIRHTREMQILKSEFKSLNALINPHFIFNTLNSVQKLINNNDRVASNRYMKILSNLIRQNMHNVSNELITLQKEMDLVGNYLELEKLRFKDKMNFSIEIEKELDLEDIMVPPLLVQPLVENAVKYGILPRNSMDSFIKITVEKKGPYLLIQVQDNGLGFKFSEEFKDRKHQSFSLENIRKRLQYLGTIYQINVRLEIKELEDVNGNVIGVNAMVFIEDNFKKKL